MTTIIQIGHGSILALSFILFFPGYSITAALFPGNRQIDWTERIVLSLGSSIVSVALLGLLLNFSPWGIRLEPVAAMVAILTVAASSVAYWRRVALPVDLRLVGSLDISIAALGAGNNVDKGLSVALAVSVVITSGVLAYVVLTPRQSETFTEFFLLGPTGKASGYPTALNVSQSGTVILGMANHEAATVNYTVRVDLVGVRIVYNATAGFNETVELNRTTLSAFAVTLADGTNWTRSYSFSIPEVGLWKVQFLLFKGGDVSSPYRELHLYVRVT